MFEWYTKLPPWAKIAIPLAVVGVIVLIWAPWSKSSATGSVPTGTSPVTGSSPVSVGTSPVYGMSSPVNISTSPVAVHESTSRVAVSGSASPAPAPASESPTIAPVVAHAVSARVKSPTEPSRSAAVAASVVTTHPSSSTTRLVEPSVAAAQKTQVAIAQRIRSVQTQSRGMNGTANRTNATRRGNVVTVHTAPVRKPPPQIMRSLGPFRGRIAQVRRAPARSNNRGAQARRQQIASLMRRNIIR